MPDKTTPDTIASLRARVAELERLHDRALADIRVLRAWVDEAGDRLWRAGGRVAGDRALEERLEDSEAEVVRLQRALEAEAELHRRARERERLLRASRTFRTGQALRDLRRVGLRRSAASLLSIARESGTKDSVA